MTKENVKEQEVKQDNEFNPAEGNPSAEGASGVNVADEAADATANVAEEGENVETSTSEPTPEEVIAVWRDKYMRLQAEFDNYRKRTLREKMDLVASGGSDVIKSMLSVLDDMYRAVAASEKSEDITALREGEKLVLQKFEEALRQKNVIEIEAVGREFDPDFHEAVARFAAGDEQKGKVIDVVQRGYMLGDKVLRYAKVVVGE